MEQLLLKMAKQLDALDEASLMGLWDKYAAQVARFEPTKRWEESALVFSFLQSKHWKNQLFNYKWAQSSKPGAVKNAMPGFKLEKPVTEVRAKILAFKAIDKKINEDNLQDNDLKKD